jgi:hypothetical protein
MHFSLRNEQVVVGLQYCDIYILILLVAEHGATSEWDVTMLAASKSDKSTSFPNQSILSVFNLNVSCCIVY